MKRSSVISIAAYVAATCGLAAADSNVWLAEIVPVYKDGAFSSATVSEQYLADDGDLYFFYVGQKCTYQINPTWSVAANPAIESWRRTSAWQNYARIEFEATAKVNLTDKLSTTVRNRFEWRRETTDFGNAQDRWRPMVTVCYAANWLPKMTSVSANYEFFYNFSNDKVAVQRYTPIKADFKLSDKTSACIYYTYQSKRAGTTNDWSGTNVLGLMGTFRF